MYEHTPPTSVACTWIYTSRGHQYAAMSWCFNEFTRFVKPSQSVIWRLIYKICLVNIPPSTTIYRSSLKRGLIYVAKVLNVFHIGKGLSVFFADTACRVPTGWLCPCIGGCVFFGGAYCILEGVFFWPTLELSLRYLEWVIIPSNDFLWIVCVIGVFLCCYG